MQELRINKNADSKQGENMQAEMQQKKYEHFETSQLEDGSNGKTGKEKTTRWGKNKSKEIMVEQS